MQLITAYSNAVTQMTRASTLLKLNLFAMHTLNRPSEKTYHSRSYRPDRCSPRCSPYLCTLCWDWSRCCHMSVGMATHMECNPCLARTFLLLVNKKGTSTCPIYL